MIIQRPGPQTVQPMGPVYLSRRLTVVRDDARWWFTFRVVQWIAALMGLVVLAALCAGCGPVSPSAGSTSPLHQPAAGPSHSPNRTPSPGQQVAGADGSTREAGATLPGAAPLLSGRRDSTGSGGSIPAGPGRRGSEEGGPPTPSAAANVLLVAEADTASDCPPEFYVVCSYPNVHCACSPPNLGRVRLAAAGATP